MKISFELEPGDIERFHEALERAERRVACAEECDIVAAARHSLQTLPIETAPGYIRQRLLQVAGWQSAAEGLYIARARHGEALQAVGAAAGNMIAIHNVVAASATVGLLGREGITLRKTILPTLYYLAMAGVIASGLSEDAQSAPIVRIFTDFVFGTPPSVALEVPYPMAGC